MDCPTKRIVTTGFACLRLPRRFCRRLCVILWLMARRSHAEDVEFGSGSSDRLRRDCQRWAYALPGQPVAEAGQSLSRRTLRAADLKSFEHDAATAFAGPSVQSRQMRLFAAAPRRKQPAGGAQRDEFFELRIDHFDSSQTDACWCEESDPQRERYKIRMQRATRESQV
jgi:hypothetical protein